MLLRHALGDTYSLTICTDAQSGAAQLMQKPDGLILDLYLPGTTGLTLMEENPALLPPVVLVLSGLATPELIQTVSQLGAGFLIRVPCTTAEVTMRLEDMLRNPGTPEPVRFHLRELRFSPGLLGYPYLCAGICLYARDKGQPFTKELYPAIAKRFGTTALAVEHAIRDVIRDAWEHREPPLWNLYFPDCPKCPSNRVFIATLAEYV